MRLKEGFTLRKLANEYIVIGQSLRQINFNKMIVLNSTAAYLWEQVYGKEFTAETLRDLLLDQYEVAPEIAAADAGTIIKQWAEAELIDI